MKNLENFGVQELFHDEIKIISGGSGEDGPEAPRDPENGCWQCIEYGTGPSPQDITFSPLGFWLNHLIFH